MERNAVNPAKSGEVESPVQQYSKRLLSGMLRLWIAGAAFGMVCVAVELGIGFLLPASAGTTSLSLDGLLNYIATPMTGGVIGYLLKSAVENKEKIHNSSPETIFPE